MASASRRDWTIDEHTLAFNLYCKIPFGTIHLRNPKLIELARLLGRSPGAVSYKLANFARLDPELSARGIGGLSHGARGEIDVWERFYKDPEALAFESERLLAELAGKSIEEAAGIESADLPRQGLERARLVRIRVGQNFFRSMVLAAHDHRCCITGIDRPELLVASHIVPWSLDPAQRLNPRNGLCLNALHDRAFDRGLMTVADDLTIRFTASARKGNSARGDGMAWLLQFDGERLNAPRRFSPDPELLRRHRLMFGTA